MTQSKTVWFFAGLLILGFGMPGISFAVTGCSNANLIGTYNAQITSASLTSVLNALNPQSGGSTGSTSGTTTAASGQDNGGLFGGNTGFGDQPGMGAPTGDGVTSGASTGATTPANPGGFGNNPRSLGGAIPGVGRYYFDGNGNIVGQGSSASTQQIVGSYGVNTDCTGTMKLSTGENFYMILSTDGSEVLFVQSDANSGGAVGKLLRGSTTCIGSGVVQTFGFSFFGAQSIPSGSGTAAAANAPGFRPASGIGQITIDGQGGFALRQWTFTSAGFRQIQSTGTYAIGSDCSLRLTFTQTTAVGGGTTGSVSAPMSFRALLISGANGELNGMIVEQVDQNTLGLGDLISQ